MKTCYLVVLNDGKGKPMQLAPVLPQLWLPTYKHSCKHNICSCIYVGGRGRGKWGSVIIVMWVISYPHQWEWGWALSLLLLLLLCHHWWRWGQERGQSLFPIVVLTVLVLCHCWWGEDKGEREGGKGWASSLSMLLMMLLLLCHCHCLRVRVWEEGRGQVVCGC